MEDNITGKIKSRRRLFFPGVPRIGRFRCRLDRKIIGALPTVTGAFPDPLPWHRLMADQNGSPSPEVKQEEEQAPQPLRLSLDGKRIVICEDEGVTQLQLRRALTRAGLNVVGIATNGRQGLEIALRERPDIILMDIHMPIMDGLEASQRILSTFQTCIVMLTAFSDEEYLDKANEIGVSGFVLKPVTGDALMPQIRKAYEAYSGHP